jgi:hypothetical protein
MCVTEDKILAYDVGSAASRFGVSKQTIYSRTNLMPDAPGYVPTVKMLVDEMNGRKLNRELKLLFTSGMKKLEENPPSGRRGRRRKNPRKEKILMLKSERSKQARERLMEQINSVRPEGWLTVHVACSKYRISAMRMKNLVVESRVKYQEGWYKRAKYGFVDPVDIESYLANPPLPGPPALSKQPDNSAQDLKQAKPREAVLESGLAHLLIALGREVNCPVDEDEVERWMRTLQESGCSRTSILLGLLDRDARVRRP